MTSVRSIRASLCLLLAAGASASGYAGCFTIYDGHQKMVYQAPETPVDMRYQLHETVPERFGAGATMVFTLSDGYCNPVGLEKPTVPGPGSAYSGYFGPAPEIGGTSRGAAVVVAPPRPAL